MLGTPCARFAHLPCCYPPSTFMPDFATTDDARDALKEALTEVLRENRDWLRELVQEALVEVADAEARREADLRAAYGDRQRPHLIAHGQA